MVTLDYRVENWIHEDPSLRTIRKDRKYLDKLARDNIFAIPMTHTNDRGEYKISNGWKQLETRRKRYYDPAYQDLPYAIIPYELGGSVLDVDSGDVFKVIAQFPDAVAIHYREGRCHIWFKSDREISKQKWSVGAESGELITHKNYVCIRYGPLLLGLRTKLAGTSVSDVQVAQYWFNSAGSLQGGALAIPSTKVNSKNFNPDTNTGCIANAPLCNNSSSLVEGIANAPLPDPDPERNPEYAYTANPTPPQELQPGNRNVGMHKWVFALCAGNAFLGHIDRGQSEADFLENAIKRFEQDYLLIPDRDGYPWSELLGTITRVVHDLHKRYRHHRSSEFAERNQEYSVISKYINNWERDCTVYRNVVLHKQSLRAAGRASNLYHRDVKVIVERLKLLLERGVWDGSDACPYERDGLPNLRYSLQVLGSTSRA